jgi:hypothetical protein
MASTGGAAFGKGSAGPPPGGYTVADHPLRRAYHAGPRAAAADVAATAEAAAAAATNPNHPLSAQPRQGGASFLASSLHPFGVSLPPAAGLAWMPVRAERGPPAHSTAHASRDSPHATAAAGVGVGGPYNTSQPIILPGGGVAGPASLAFMRAPRGLAHSPGGGRAGAGAIGLAPSLARTDRVGYVGDPEAARLRGAAARWEEGILSAQIGVMKLSGGGGVGWGPTSPSQGHITPGNTGGFSGMALGRTDTVGAPLAAEGPQTGYTGGLGLSVGDDTAHGNNLRGYLPHQPSR